MSVSEIFEDSRPWSGGGKRRRWPLGVERETSRPPNFIPGWWKSPENRTAAFGRKTHAVLVSSLAILGHATERCVGSIPTPGTLGDVVKRQTHSAQT